MSKRLKIWSLFLAFLTTFAFGLFSPAIAEWGREREAEALAKAHIAAQLKAPLQMQWDDINCLHGSRDDIRVVGHVYAMNAFGVLLPHVFEVQVSRNLNGDLVVADSRLFAMD